MTRRVVEKGLLVAKKTTRWGCGRGQKRPGKKTEGIWGKRRRLVRGVGMDHKQRVMEMQSKSLFSSPGKKREDQIGGGRT